VSHPLPPLIFPCLSLPSTSYFLSPLLSFSFPFPLTLSALFLLFSLFSSHSPFFSFPLLFPFIYCFFVPTLILCFRHLFLLYLLLQLLFFLILFFLLPLLLTLLPCFITLLFL
jgi:hypothetical protein